MRMSPASSLQIIGVLVHKCRKTSELCGGGSWRQRQSLSAALPTSSGSKRHCTTNTIAPCRAECRQAISQRGRRGAAWRGARAVCTNANTYYTGARAPGHKLCAEQEDGELINSTCTALICCWGSGV